MQSRHCTTWTSFINYKVQKLLCTNEVSSPCHGWIWWNERVLSWKTHLIKISSRRVYQAILNFTSKDLLPCNYKTQFLSDSLKVKQANMVLIKRKPHTHIQTSLINMFTFLSCFLHIISIDMRGMKPKSVGTGRAVKKSAVKEISSLRRIYLSNKHYATIVYTFWWEKLNNMHFLLYRL